LDKKILDWIEIDKVIDLPRNEERDRFQINKIKQENGLIPKYTITTLDRTLGKIKVIG